MDAPVDSPCGTTYGTPLLACRLPHVCPGFFTRLAFYFSASPCRENNGLGRAVARSEGSTRGASSPAETGRPRLRCSHGKGTRQHHARQPGAITHQVDRSTEAVTRHFHAAQKARTRHPVLGRQRSIARVSLDTHGRNRHLKFRCVPSRPVNFIAAPEWRRFWPSRTPRHPSSFHRQRSGCRS